MITADRKDPLLRIDNLTVHYGAAQALFGIGLRLPADKFIVGNAHRIRQYGKRA